jgi:hypothetical protein
LFSICRRIFAVNEGVDMNHPAIDEGPILGFIALAIALAMMLAA